MHNITMHNKQNYMGPFSVQYLPSGYYTSLECLAKLWNKINLFIYDKLFSNIKIRCTNYRRKQKKINRIYKYCHINHKVFVKPQEEVFVMYNFYS